MGRKSIAMLRIYWYDLNSCERDVQQSKIQEIDTM